MHIRLSRDKLINHIKNTAIPKQESVMDRYYLDIAEEADKWEKKNFLYRLFIPNPLKIYKETYTWGAMERNLERMYTLLEVAELSESYVSITSDEALLLDIKKDTF